MTKEKECNSGANRMKHALTLMVLVLISTAPTMTFAKGDKYKDLMEEWKGASQEEVVAGWGNPQSQSDIVKIDDKTTVYTYRSMRMGMFGVMPCTVSFTLTNKTVSDYKYEGGNCPKNKRQKK